MVSCSNVKLMIWFAVSSAVKQLTEHLLALLLPGFQVSLLPLMQCCRAAVLFLLPGCRVGLMLLLMAAGAFVELMPA